MALLIDQTKLQACKNDGERLMLGFEALEAEFSKKIAERKPEDIAETKRMVDEAMASFVKSLEDRFPQFKLSGVKGGDDSKRDQFSIARAALAFKHNNWSIAPYEKEVYDSKEHQDFLSKAASFSIDPSGGFMIPNEISSKFIERLLASSIAGLLGVNIEDVGNVGMLAVNRETGSATAEWVGEMLTATRSQVTLGQMNLTPHAVSAKGDISNLLQLLGSGAAESRFIRSASKQMALAWDRAILIGANSALGPLGVVNTLGVGTSSGASLTYDKLVDFEDKLDQANANMGTLGWAMSASKYTEIRKLKDTASQPIVYRSVTDKRVRELFGYPLFTSTQMGTTGAGTLIYGAWDMATLYRWFGGIMIKRSDTSDNALDNDLTRVALRAYCDVGIDQPTAFCVSSD
jgi:HK97 family phage major capsid protein